MNTYFKSYIIAIYHAKTNKFKFKNTIGIKIDGNLLTCTEFPVSTVV